MKKAEAQVLDKWNAFGYQGRLAGHRCLIRCNWCEKTKEIVYSKVKKGGGKYCSRECAWKGLRKTIKMSNHPNWKGGRRTGHHGYVLIKQKDGSYKREHRIVMEKKLSRKLESWEFVHHKNGVKDDNRPENLKLVVAQKHYGNIRCPHCMEKFYIK